MRIGIGLPASIPSTRGELVLEWARAADAGPFSSLALIDRLVYPNYEPMITFAACAGATQRIRLMSSVLLAPLRNPAILAKEAASLDALSGGRLTLGLGLGAREDDYAAAEIPFHERGKRFDAQLALMKSVWAGEPASADTGKIGPAPARPGGPEILLGGYSPAAMRRVGRWADGIIAGSGAAAMAAQIYALAVESWQEAKRPGKPRFVGCFYYGLGPDALERAGAYIRDYYRFMGPNVEGMAQSIPATPDAVQQMFESFREAGADEVIAWPCIADMSQLHLLAELVGE